jgi:hypothetical protein
MACVIGLVYVLFAKSTLHLIDVKFQAVLDEVCLRLLDGEGETKVISLVDDVIFKVRYIIGIILTHLAPIGQG